jgi:drug/metabolite transporter (DMT)-like permease
MTLQKSMSGRAWAELFLLALIWGAVFLAVRITLDEVPVLTSVLHRTGWAMIVLWAVVLMRGLAVPRAPRIWLAFFVMGMLNNLIPFGLMAWGQLHIESGLTSILNATTAIFGVMVAAALLPDERLTWRKGLGVGIGFAGVVVAIGAEALMRFDIRSTAQLAVLGGTLSYAFAGVWARTRLKGLSPVVAAAGMLTASTLTLIPLTLWIDGVPSLDLAPVTWIAIAYVAVIATAGAYLLYYRVLDMAGSGNLMLVTLLIPPVAITLGALVLGEALPPRAFAGFALLALGLSILNGLFGRQRD